MGDVLITLQQVTILFIEIGVGYYVMKRGRITAAALGPLTYLVCNVALPCAIVYPIIHLENNDALWSAIGAGVTIIAVCTAVQILVSCFLFRKESATVRPVYQMATVYGNSAFIGIPLVTAILGTDSVIYATLMVIVDTVCLFTQASLSMAGAAPTPKFIVKKIFGLATVSLIIGVVILVTGFQVPDIAMTVMFDIKGLMTPLAMIIVGAQLAQKDFAKIFSLPKRYLVSLMKLVVWPAIIAACLLPFRAVFPAIAIVTILICKATPQAAVLGVLAQDNGLDGDEAAAVVGLTTILSVVTLPIMASVFQALFI